MNKWIHKFQNRITSKKIKKYNLTIRNETLITNVNLVWFKPHNPQQRVFGLSKILKYSDLEWSTQNPCVVEHNKDHKIWRNTTMLISPWYVCRSNEELGRETLTSKIFISFQSGIFISVTFILHNYLYCYSLCLICTYVILLNRSLPMFSHVFTCTSMSSSSSSKRDRGVRQRGGKALTSDDAIPSS